MYFCAMVSTITGAGMPVTSKCDLVAFTLLAASLTAY
jgi:hypothetical protein